MIKNLKKKTSPAVHCDRGCFSQFSWLLSFWGFFLVLVVKVNNPNNSYDSNENRYYNCTHIYSSFSFLFLTSHSPAPNVEPDATIIEMSINGLSKSPKTEDSSKAVTIYFTTSISHFPNSFLISKDINLSPTIQGNSQIIGCLVIYIVLIISIKKEISVLS